MSPDKRKPNNADAGALLGRSPEESRRPLVTGGSPSMIGSFQLLFGLSMSAVRRIVALSNNLKLCYVMLPIFYFTIGTGIAAFLLWIINDATAPRL